MAFEWSCTTPLPLSCNKPSWLCALTCPMRYICEAICTGYTACPTHASSAGAAPSILAFPSCHCHRLRHCMRHLTGRRPRSTRVYHYLHI